VDGGSLEILGMPVGDGANDRAIKSRLGVVAQEDNLDKETSVRANLEVFCRFYGLNADERRRRCDELLAFAHLEDKAEQRVQTLSGGMKRRLMIARGLISRPDLVLLDEPTTGLDPRARQDIWDKLGALRQEQTTIVLTTHYMEEAERLCDRIAVMDKGRIVAVGSPAELIAEHVPPHVIEIRLGLTAEVPDAAEPLFERAERAEVLRDRVLLYVERPDEILADVSRALPGHPTLVRRASLEDVFLSITGTSMSAGETHAPQIQD
jgi:lipooligosaccharide transport system ATP-binding protein